LISEGKDYRADIPGYIDNPAIGDREIHGDGGLVEAVFWELLVMSTV
jgi:hypothetical protein